MQFDIRKRAIRISIFFFSSPLLYPVLFFVPLGTLHGTYWVSSKGALTRLQQVYTAVVQVDTRPEKVELDLFGTGYIAIIV